MNTLKLVMVTAFMFCFHAKAENKDTHHHGHEKTSAAVSVTKPTKKYSVDENLKTKMDAVLNVMKKLHTDEKKKPTEEQMKVAAQKIEAEVNAIFKTCKLAPEADAAIHPILSNLLDGARLLKKGKMQDGHKKIHKALLTYENFFDHPNWSHSKEE